MTGLAEPDYDTTISFGLPFEPEDSQYGKSSIEYSAWAMEVQLSQLWTAASVLAGFQVAALTWRIKRELEMEAEGETTWVTLPDGFVVASFLVLVFGVFAAPILCSSIEANTAAKWFVLALVLFVSSVFVLAGHYNLYCSWDKYCSCYCHASVQSGGAECKSCSCSMEGRPKTKPRGRATKQEWTSLLVPGILVTVYVIWWVWSWS